MVDEELRQEVMMVCGHEVRMVCGNEVRKAWGHEVNVRCEAN